MRIAIFSDNFYPELSGISDSIITLGKELAHMGHQVCFVAARYTKKNFEKAGHAPRELDLGPNIQFLRLFALPMPSATGQGRFAIPWGASIAPLKKFKPDVIYTNHFGGVGLEALKAAKALRVPLVGTSHTPMREFMKYSPIHNEWATNKVLKYVSWYYNHCDYVTAPSKFLFEEMIAYGFKKPHRVLSNPIHTEEFQPVENNERKAELKKQFGIAGPALIYTGRLAPEKHVDVLIRALAIVKKSIPDAAMLIAGHGTAEKQLKELARELGIADSIKFLGFVSEEALLQVYQAADVFTVASTAEMQCLSMMNAMLCGLPVIGVRAGALPEYINDQNGFVVEPGDVNAMAEKILRLFQNPDQAAMLGRGGRAYAEQFSSQNIAKEWLVLFQEIIDSHK